MRKSILDYSRVSQLAKTDIAYAIGDERLIPFYQFTPDLDTFQKVIEEKAGRKYPRTDLVETLRHQYQSLPEKKIVAQNIAALQEESTFTIVTAHQPTLFAGPLYFFYKALTTIRLALEVERKSTGKHRVVSVFVLGSEDHDLEEVNKVNLFGKQLVWQPNESGPVGSMSTASLKDVLAEFSAILGEDDRARALFQRIERCYTGSETFAGATQALLHEFLGDLGLVVLNMNDPRLKKHFIPVIRAELLEQPSFRLVSETIAQLSGNGFKTQATPREINLFYMLPGKRERIVREQDTYQVLNTSIQFTQEQILEELEQHPERFSPNVVLRPLYQEMILPNLAYVGGGGELAYWLERKSLFQYFQIPMPMLVRRHSILWLDRDVLKKLHKAGFTASEFFADTDTLIRNFVEKHASAEVSLEPQIQTLRSMYQQLAEKAKAIDPTLEGSLMAESVKAISGLEQWQSRLVRAEKQKHETALQQIRSLKEKLFPAGGLQERHDNIWPYLLKYGDEFIGLILQYLEPFDPGFVILEEEPVA
ncbi:MAG TPA: bacillithiol biosynthesis cysteine-adding enzyme BshC [Saprospirales bacterium]|nr:bacillithiol biosynthesis cysteine-adding enzyme BshC [Saprospirales bacterium]